MIANFYLFLYKNKKKFLIKYGRNYPDIDNDELFSSCTRVSTTR